MQTTIPVILFAYARPDHIRRTLESLRENNVPIIYIFSDGPKTPDKEPAVQEVRKILHEIDWCKTIITEREKNLGLGRSILTGVTEVFQKEKAVIVFEDDLICVPGTYAYLCTAMERYRDDNRVMSITGWTHPRVIPSDVGDRPYFDGRAECLVWGTWKRSWRGMDKDALTLIEDCKQKGINIGRYGNDLIKMAKEEEKQNIWAVRWSYHHIADQGLCLRPPWSMVEHIGFDKYATNASKGSYWSNPPLEDCPHLPQKWPEPVENIQCPYLWQKAVNLKFKKRLNLIQLIKGIITNST